MPTSESIKVAFRVRPLNQKETQKGCGVATVAHVERGVIEITNPSSEDAKQFTFDHVFGDQSTQVQVYNTVCAPVVNSCLEGYNGTIFCFGQTGAGKVSSCLPLRSSSQSVPHTHCRSLRRKYVQTHTMEGAKEPKEMQGVMPNAFSHVFDSVALNGSDEISDKFLIR